MTAADAGASARGAGVELGVFVLAPQFPDETQAAALTRARDVAVAADDAGLTHASRTDAPPHHLSTQLTSRSPTSPWN